jgi:hypothetical protein
VFIHCAMPVFRRCHMRYTDLITVLILCCAAGCSNNNNSVVNSDNSVPVIKAITCIPDTVYAGQSCLVSCVVDNKDNDTLDYIWEAAGNISGSGPTITYSMNSCFCVPQIRVTVIDRMGGCTDSVFTVPFR